MRLFVLSHNPIISSKNSKCINVHIMNDGNHIYAFNDILSARYMKKRYVPDNYIVPIKDPRVLLEYCESNSILKGLKVIKGFHCDLESKRELCEVEDMNIFSRLLAD